MADELISGATASTYVTTATDVGRNLYCKVTGTNAFGSASASSNTVGPIVAGSSEDAATTAWVNAVVTAGGTVSSGRRTVVDTLIAGLKADGVWTLLDRLWILAAENTQSALTDLKGLVTISNSPPGGGTAPTFTADRGLTGNGAGIDTGFNPTTASSPQYTLNSGSMFVYNRSTRSTGVVVCEFGMQDAGLDYRARIVCLDTGGTYLNVNDNYGPLAGITSVQGFWVGSRTSSMAADWYKNATAIRSETVVANNAALINRSFYICGINWDYGNTYGSPDQLACAGFGAGLSSAQVTALTTRIETYMDAVGAGVI